MSRTFFPKAHYLPIGSGYKPLFRWFEESSWTMVPNTPALPTVKQALAAAEAYMKTRMNPPIRAEKIETPVREGLVDEVQEFLVRRDKWAEEERRSVFGSDGPAMVFPRRGKPVQVERRRRA